MLRPRPKAGRQLGKRRASFSSIWWRLFCVSVSMARANNIVPYSQTDDALFLSEFETLTADSHVAMLPQDLHEECASGSAGQELAVDLPSITVRSGEVSAADLMELCGVSSVCIVPPGSTLRMTSSINVAALVIEGILLWDDSTQSMDDQWLCAGYVAIERDGQFNLNVVQSRAWVYIKNNGEQHDILGSRAFGSVGGYIRVRGKPLQRTFSLLALPADRGATNIQLLHDPVAMGWVVGDRIAIAPTTSGSGGTADARTITAIDSSGTLTLSSPTTQAFEATLLPDALRSAEVVLLTRNVIITGDDFSHEGGKTIGLHTVGMYSGTIQIEHARIEKCGQRGILGKYCLHFHLLRDCADCRFVGNAVEFGMQRGIVIHGTHRSTVQSNVIYDVRGASIYIEDGNERDNRLLYNVAICPWSREGPKRGCTVPGTDNNEADTSLNQAGMWCVREHVSSVRAGAHASTLYPCRSHNVALSCAGHSL